MRRYVWWAVVVVFTIFFGVAVWMFIQWHDANGGLKNTHAMRVVACNKIYSYLAIVPDGQDMVFLLTDGKGKYVPFVIPKDCTSEYTSYPERSFTWRWMPKSGPDWYKGMAVVRYGPRTSSEAEHHGPPGIELQ